MTLKTRLKSLEKIRPRIDPNTERLRNMSKEELEDEIFQTKKKLFDAGNQWDVSEIGYGGGIFILCIIPKIRQFVTKGGEPWLRDYSHRRDVCWDFKERALKQSLYGRVVETLTDGWRDYVILTEDIDWVVKELEGYDLGEEQPWLRGYLEHSGKR